MCSTILGNYRLGIEETDFGGTQENVYELFRVRFLKDWEVAVVKECVK